ncbi:MAG TPA: histidine kinase [Nakamurella sp.]
MAWRRRTAQIGAVIAVSITALGLLVAVLLLVRAPTAAGWLNLLVGAAAAVPCAVLGLRIVRVTPVRSVGLLLATVGAGVGIVVAREVWFQALAGWNERQWWAPLVAVLAEGAWWVLAAVALLLLYFPTGRPPGRRWGAVPPALVTCVTVTQLYGALEPVPFQAPLAELSRPFGPPPVWLDLLSGPAFMLMLLLALACAASLIPRYRRADRQVRRQIKWLGIAGLGVVGYPLLCLVEILIWGEPTWGSAVVGVGALVAVPVTTGIAVLRPDLYDVDKALSQALTWATVSVLLIIGYAGIALTVGVLVGRNAPLAAAAGAAVCALAFLPLGRRVRRMVDARIYPLRRRAVAALDALHREVTAGTAEPELLQDTLRTALRDPELRVGYRVPGSEGFVDTDGSPVPALGATPVALDGSSIGVLATTPAGREARGLSDELLGDVAVRCTTLVEVVRLRLEVSRALAEIQASRARLVQVGLQERRGLERDLHDGAQQRLVALGMSLRLAQRHLTDGTVDVGELLDQSVAELGTAVAELRQIAHGLRPSSLDDGLPAALARLVRSVPVRVEMDVHDGPLPDDVATTAYYVVSEAIANAVKHAEASRIELNVARSDGHVVVRVSDDGRGGAQLGNGSAMADRVQALGGSLRVASPRGTGTTVEAALPCAS